MTSFRNLAISASAGTGKTFRLAHRYLGLMAAGVSPDRICALTFSRKAAGEIFDKIVAHLCMAATDGKKRVATGGIIAAEGFCQPPDKPESYVDMLRKLLDNEHRLRIGTLDSFILGVVRAFPLELGIPPETEPVDGDGGESMAMRLAIMTRLFDPTRGPGAGSGWSGSSFLKDFRMACFGQETKTLVSVLDALISEHYGFYRRHNGDKWGWGEGGRIWKPTQQWWDERGGVTVAELPVDLEARLVQAFGSGNRPVALAAACARIAEAAASHSADKPWPELNETTLRQLLPLAPQLEPAVLTYYGKAYTIPADLWSILQRALRRLISVEVARALARTRGLRAVLDRYDQLYADALNKDGRFTFEDLSRLLGADGLSPSRMPDAPDRLFIDYRLDGKLDHWLLDEFQDTSDTQWSALANLIDEVIQDENRSFFYVGDVKQSVYGWRGGNHRLFGDVLGQYRKSGKRRIVLESISQCHRSLPAVIATINEVFDELSFWTPSAGPGKGPREGAVKAFAHAWHRHESARLDEGDGFAALLEYAQKTASQPPETGDDESSDDPAEFEAVVKVLEHVQPVRNGLTAAVLVRSNRDGRACVDVLRRQLPGVPVVHEGKGGIVDNPVVTVMLALVRYAAHPGDSLALRHIQMSPLAGWPELRDPDSLPAEMLRAFSENGFAGTLRQWGERLGVLDDFGLQRLREFLAAAEEFDATGARDPDAFGDFINSYQVHAGAAEGTVRVMTVHQAKGLGFDLVIVPFNPAARSFEKPGDPELLAGDTWVLDPPCRQALDAAGGPPLGAVEAARADANFAQLCVLYVALTRAQKALYMLIPGKGKSSSTVREADLLRERLATAGPATGPGGLVQLYAAGDDSWFSRTGKSKAAPPICQRLPVRVTFAAGVTRREPSKEHEESRAFPAQWLFKTEAGDVRAFGSAIHRLFQKIEWIEESDIDKIVAGYRAEAPLSETILADVEKQFRTCLANSEIRRRLARPAGAAAAEVWREAPFDLVMETEGKRYLMSGRFDRLVVERDAAGRPTRATVFDFKSNRVESEADLEKAADGYAGQMTDYARAAARILGLQAGQVSTVLLFTRAGWLRER